ncbi:MAG: O-antigen ligase/tetratricopeptide (TPR) repeat protein [Planctomycetota bacterium]|jgi:O-antigen ligase/tetratricopeptide (TPR) repeat protein
MNKSPTAKFPPANKMSESSNPESTDGMDATRAWASLLPAIVLAGTALHGVPSADSSGAGWVTLAAMPAAALLIASHWKRRLQALPLFFALLALIEWARVATDGPFDSFEADRTWMLLVTGLVMMLSGASLKARGRAIYLRGLVILSALWLAGAAIDTWLSATRAWSGVLENTGDLAAAALPGALIAMVGAGRVGAAALLPALGWVAYVLAVPVHGSAIAGALALILLITQRLKQTQDPVWKRALFFLTVLVLLGPASGLMTRSSSSVESTASTSIDKAPTDAEDDSLGGVAFRLRTWARLPALLATVPLTGVGPGQVSANFGLYRSPQDIEDSSFGRRAPYDTVVESLHNDWLELFAQLGLPGGLVALAFLLLALRAALRSLRSGDAMRSAAGLATLGLLAQMLTSSTLLQAPASSVIAFALIGIVFAHESTSIERPLSRVLYRALPVLVLLLALGSCMRAMDFIKHGRALAALSSSALVKKDGIVGHSAQAKASSLEHALAACPDSPLALTEQAALRRSIAAPLDKQREAWERVLQHRPHQLEALVALANLHARSREFSRARELYEDAALVDANNPALLQSRLMLAIDVGGSDELIERLLAARPGTLIPMSWLRERAANCLRDGRPSVANSLLQVVDSRLSVWTGEEAYALEREFTDSDGLLAEGMLTWAHQAWARAHIDAGAPEVAVRSYRQSLRASRAQPESKPGAPAIRLELAAALLLADRRDDAAIELQNWRPEAISLRELPEWAGQALLNSGLLLHE